MKRSDINNDIGQMNQHYKDITETSSLNKNQNIIVCLKLNLST